MTNEILNEKDLREVLTRLGWVKTGSFQNRIEYWEPNGQQDLRSRPHIGDMGVILPISAGASDYRILLERAYAYLNGVYGTRFTNLLSEGGAKASAQDRPGMRFPDRNRRSFQVKAVPSSWFAAAPVPMAAAGGSEGAFKKAKAGRGRGKRINPLDTMRPLLQMYTVDEGKIGKRGAPVPEIPVEIIEGLIFLKVDGVTTVRPLSDGSTLGKIDKLP